MGQGNTKCSCCEALKEDKDTAKFDNESNHLEKIISIKAPSIISKSPPEDNQPIKIETSSNKDLKSFVTFKNAAESHSRAGSTTEKDPNEQVIAANNKKHTSILVHKAQVKKEKKAFDINNDNHEGSSKTKASEKEPIPMQLHAKMLLSKQKKEKSSKNALVNSLSNVNKDLVKVIQRRYRGFIYRKKYKKVKKEQIDYTNQLIKDLYNKYVTQTLREMEMSIGIKHDSNSWKSFGVISSSNVGSALGNELKLFSKLKIIDGKYQGIYAGQVDLNNKMNGRGVLIKSDGSKSDGTWEKNAFNGLGRIINTEGSLYEGFFIKGKLKGKGMKKSLNKTVYVGDFKNSLKEGRGEEDSKETLYEGCFVNDEKHGQGKLTYKLLKDTYEGEFTHNCITGKGKYVWANKETYEGTFKNGKMDGKGLYKWPNGDEYEGDYANNLKEGQGLFKWSNGKTFNGEFKKGKPCGDGVLKLKDKEYSVTFDNGKIVGKVKALRKEEEEEEENFNENGEESKKNVEHEDAKDIPQRQGTNTQLQKPFNQMIDESNSQSLSNSDSIRIN